MPLFIYKYPIFSPENIRYYTKLIASHFITNPYAPFLAQMVIIRRCNLKCSYCNEYDNTSEPVPIEQLKKNIRFLSKLGLNALCLTGGEPTLHPGLLDIIDFANTKINKVSLITNGFTIKKSLIEKLNEAHLSRLQISIDGVKKNKMTEKTLCFLAPKLKLLAEQAKFKVHINSVLGSIPFNETLEVVRFARQLGFETTVQWLHDHNGYFLNPYNIGFDEIKQLEKELNIPLFHSRDVIRVGLNKQLNWKCRAGSRYLYIDEKSKAHYCSQQRSLWSCKVEELTKKILKKNFYISKKCSSRCTLGCVHDSSRYDFFRKQY